MPGETNSLLSLVAVTTNRVGDYAAVVSNPYGSATSQVATLTVDGTGCGGFEGDVAPRPAGNNAISVSDWVQVGRFAAGLDTVLNSCEFQRADCAPRMVGTNLACGDGRLSVADWTQAGRYAAGVDPLTPVCGPEAPGSAGVFAGQFLPLDKADKMSAVPGSTVRVVGRKLALGQAAYVTLDLEASGEENAVGFTLEFDPGQLRYERALGIVDAALQVNTNQAALGRVGVVLAKPVGQSFGAGAIPVMQVHLTPLGALGEVGLSPGDAPVIREIASTAAEVVPATFEGGTLRVIQPGRLGTQVQLAGGTAELFFIGQVGERYRIEASTDLQHWSLLEVKTAGAEPILARDTAAGEYRQRFYRAVPEP